MYHLVPVQKSARRPPKKPVKRVRTVVNDRNKEAFIRQAEEAVRVSFLGGISRFKRRLPKAKLDEMFNRAGYDGLRKNIPWSDLPEDLKPVAEHLGKLMDRQQRHVDAIGRDEVDTRYRLDPTNPEAAKLTQERIGKYLQDLSDEANEHVHRTIAEHRRTGGNPKDLADRLKDGLGLNDRQNRALAKFENGLIASGKYTEAQVAAKKKKKAEQMLNQRARTVAITETRVAANGTELRAWQAQAEDGILSPESKRVWVTEPGCCDVCTQLSGVAVGLYEDWVLPDGRKFAFPGTVHPNCRCTSYLQDEDT